MKSVRHNLSEIVYQEATEYEASGNPRESKGSLTDEKSNNII